MQPDTRILAVEMPDGSIWGIPVMVIARSRAAFYADEFGGDIERSLAEDTLPLFAEDSGEIMEWAANDMNWSDVQPSAKKLRDRSPLTPRGFQEGWTNGPKKLQEPDAA